MRVECSNCKRVHWVNPGQLDAVEGDLILKCKGCEETITIHKASKMEDTSVGATRVKKDFSGSLEVMGVPDVVQMCHLGMKTGRLVLSSPRGSMSVYFRDGNMVYAVPDDEREGMAYYLFKNDRIDLGQLGKIKKSVESDKETQENAIKKHP